MEEREVNKERVRLVVAALRSGEFQQTQQHLAEKLDDGTIGYCCLGVICEVAITNGLKLARTPDPDTDGAFQYRGTSTSDWSRTVLPETVQQWLGIRKPDPRLEAPPQHRYSGALEANAESYEATTLNDDLEWDFNMIADAMEYTWLREEGQGGSESDQQS